VSRLQRIALAAAAVAVLVALFFVFRPGDDDETAGETTTTTAGTTSATTTTGTTETTTTTTATTTAPARSKALVIRIKVEDGQVAGGIQRATIPKGRIVRLVVRADVSDEVHLHGYDVMRDVAPGKPARLRFRATIPGRFEVELESRKLLIAELEVSP
jgi:heme/copper-type cytochrome/quinol oxidase subunit 2